jgi:hypothetical protein
MTPSTFSKTVPVLGLFLWPFVVGALPSYLFWPLFIGSSAIAVYAFARESGRAKKITLALASVALTISISDSRAGEPENVMHWALSDPSGFLPQVVADVIIQDEFTHDVRAALPPGSLVCRTAAP